MKAGKCKGERGMPVCLVKTAWSGEGSLRSVSKDFKVGSSEPHVWGCWGRRVPGRGNGSAKALRQKCEAAQFEDWSRGQGGQSWVSEEKGVREEGKG